VLQTIYRLIPRSLLDLLFRAQWRVPWLRKLLGSVSVRLRNREGVIAHGVGQGLRFNPAGTNASYLLGLDEPELQRALSEIVQPGMTFVDVGANVGFISVIAARMVGSTGRVVCFEPVRETAGHLRRNLALNGFAHATVSEVALAARDGEADLVIPSSPTMARFASIGTFGETTNTVTVPTRRIDSLIERGELPIPDVVKVDVEGAEVGVLEGAREMLKHHRPILIVELHDTNEAIAALLAEYEYSIHPVGGVASIVDAPRNTNVVAIPAERTDLQTLVQRAGDLT